MKNNLFVIPFSCFLSSCTMNSNNGQINSFPEKGHWIDLSYDYSSETLYWPTDAEGFRLDTIAVGFTEAGYYYSSFSFCAPEHGGTHLDAPLHFAEGKHSVDQLPLERLTGPAVVLDISEKALQNRDYLVTIADIQAWGEERGQILESIICSSVPAVLSGCGKIFSVQGWLEKKVWLTFISLDFIRMRLLGLPGKGKSRRRESIPRV